MSANFIMPALGKEKTCCKCNRLFYGAGNEARTRYLHLGKVALYRMSYARVSMWYSTTFF